MAASKLGLEYRYETYYLYLKHKLCVSEDLKNTALKLYKGRISEIFSYQ